MARELDDAILMLRTNELEVGTWILKTRGDADAVLAIDATLEKHRDDWFVREVSGMLRRTFARFDVSSRTLFAIIERGSCFAGTLAEMAFAADRSYMLLSEEQPDAPCMVLSEMNFGAYPMVNHLTRLATRYCGDEERIATLRSRIGDKLDAAAARDLGLITFAPDDIDWDEEVRIAIEERASLSPDALTGMEANLRFPAPKPWRHEFSAGSPHGRTGSSTGRTPSANTVRSRCSVPEASRSSIGRGCELEKGEGVNEQIATASLSELDTNVEIAKRLGYLKDDALHAEIDAVSALLMGLHASVRKKLD